MVVSNSLNRYIVIRYRVTNLESRISDVNVALQSVFRRQLIRLIRRGKFRGHAERPLQYASGRDCLNSFLVFERALLVMIREAPARFNAKESSAIGPQGEVRARPLDRESPSGRWADRHRKIDAWAHREAPEYRSRVIPFLEKGISPPANSISRVCPER